MKTFTAERHEPMRRTGIKEYFLNAGPIEVVTVLRVAFVPRRTSSKPRVLN